MSPVARLLGGRYEIGELLGRGGMAEVRLGRDARLGRTVAVKVLRSDLARDPSFLARFRREAQSAAALNHPSVVAVYDSGEEPAVGDQGPTPFIVMEHVDGRTLREMLPGGGALDWQHALRITSSVLAALAYSHRAGIVHRDIKPANVMVTTAGDVKVMDFGIARAVADTSATMTQTQAVIGTAQYLSPEQARGETVDARSDIYSAGCLLYELLTGRPPFVGDSPVAVAYQHVGEPPQPPSTFTASVPPDVDAVVLHALVKDRDSRYQSADDFRDDVEAVLAGRPVSAAARGSAAALGGAATVMVAPLTEEAAATARLQPLDGRPAEPELPAGAPDPRRRTGLWVLLGVVVAALVAVAVLVLPNVINPAPREVAVPQLVGHTQADAVAQLRAGGFVVGTTSQAPSASVAKGSVVSSDPGGSTQVPTGSTVDLVMSSGPPQAQVPDLEGLSRDDAEQALQAVGLRVGDVSQVESAEHVKGEVVSSDPVAGTDVDDGTQVDLQLANGKVDVPNVSGYSLADAVAALTKAGLGVDASAYRESTQPVGTVIEQSDQNKTVDRGTTVTLVIAKAPAQPTNGPTDTATGTPTGTPSDTPTDTPSGTATP